MPHGANRVIAVVLSPALLCISVAALGSVVRAADDADAGMLAFNNHCRQCHSYMKGDNRLGPSLYGVVGRKAGTAPGYGNYSDSVKASGVTWTPENIDKWITNPEAFLPNNNMKPFGGVADPRQRQEIIAFLKSDTSRGVPGGARHSSN